MTVVQFRPATDSRTARAAEILRQKADALRKAGVGIGEPCATCIHFPPEPKDFYSRIMLAGMSPNCRHPVYEDVAFDVVTGKLNIKRTSTASAARLSDGLCGPEGALHEPIPPKLNPFQRALHWLASLRERIEARRVETPQSGSIHESRAEGLAQNPSQPLPGDH